MTTLVSESIEGLARAVGPEPDDVLVEMNEYGEEIGFPTVGPEVGGVLRLLARIVGAEKIFEFGSGFGYSGYWFASALPDDGEIVLTEHDADELELAREYFERGGISHLAEFEGGDAMEIVDEYDGPFDVVLIDHQKERYAEAFEIVRDRVSPGGLVITDNIVATNEDFSADVLALLSDAAVSADSLHQHAPGIAEYLETVDADPDFETVLIPLGEGISVSYKSP